MTMQRTLDYHLPSVGPSKSQAPSGFTTALGIDIVRTRVLLPKSKKKQLNQMAKSQVNPNSETESNTYNKQKRHTMKHQTQYEGRN